ncbi:MAG: NAD(P)/FAD-dependent oxidoreductase [Nocardioides sp.]
MWAATAPARGPAPGLTQDLEVDVAIVGAGYTGLWTAYYLARSAPNLRIVVIEAETVGFGASGRNGGWASALFPASMDTVAAMSSPDAAIAQDRAMRLSINEIIAVTDAEGIEADIAHGGTVVAARTPAQLVRAEDEVADALTWGRTDATLLGAQRAAAAMNATGTLAASATTDCAAVHPLKLARGLAEAVERLGVRIAEHTRAVDIAPHQVTTTGGVVGAAHVVRATEGFTPALPGLKRQVIPVYSLMIATEPLTETTWSEIGLADRQTFSDHRHLIIYGQRTADGRLVFGGRGAPYAFGSRVRPSLDRDDAVFAALRETLVDMFPVLATAKIDYAWGGPLGIARDWCPSVGLDPTTGIGWAGGYVGDGVTTTNLAGRTLRDLILGTRSDLTALPWVNHRSPAWEPEPLRWIGVNLGLRATMLADREEAVTGRPSRIARTLAPLLG